jgi:hypothetical protein
MLGGTLPASLPKACQSRYYDDVPSARDIAPLPCLSIKEGGNEPDCETTAQPRSMSFTNEKLKSLFWDINYLFIILSYHRC